MFFWEIFFRNLGIGRSPKILSLFKRLHSLRPQSWVLKLVTTSLNVFLKLPFPFVKILWHLFCDQCYAKYHHIFNSAVIALCFDNFTLKEYIKFIESFYLSF